MTLSTLLVIVAVFVANLYTLRFVDALSKRMDERFRQVEVRLEHLSDELEMLHVKVDNVEIRLE